MARVPVSRLRVRLSMRRPGRRALRRNLVALALALLAALIAGILQGYRSQALFRGDPLYALESAAQDAVLRGRNPDNYGSSIGRPVRQLITIAAMDDRSLSELGMFRTWPRSYQTQLLDALLQSPAPPRVVAFDVGFFEPSPDDAQLVAAFERARARRVGVVIVAGSGSLVSGPGGLLEYRQALMPVPALAAVADVASGNLVPDDLGVVRSMPLLMRLDDQEMPTLGLAAVAKYLRQPRVVLQRPNPDTVVFAGRQVPVDRFSQARINYFGPPTYIGTDRPTFPVVSFVDVIKGRADSSVWRDGIVLVGLQNATGFADDYWTPVSDQGQKMAGVEIHANVAGTLFSTQFLREAPLGVNLALVLLLSLLVGIVAANLGVLSASLASLALLGVYYVGNLTALDLGTQAALANPLLGGFLAFVAVVAYRVIVEQRQARALQGALASVIPASVAQEIARDPDRVRLGGERRTISVLFSDLKGFTTFSETVEPEVLSQVITEYLDGMTAVVFRHGGTVDKFIGDAVMAFWNAPLDDPDHARHACEAALDMQAALRDLGDQWQARGLPRQRMRIGVNTGPVSVGNMGTTQRFAYTAFGDTVNLGARLEPLNNEYGTWTCLSQATLDAAGGPDRFLVRFLDLVAVKGKTAPVPVYELIGRTQDTALLQQYAPVLELYHRAMVLYQARGFAEAQDLFQQAMRAHVPLDGTEDPPSTVYADRCRDLIAAPPAPDWDGVFVMHHK